MACDSLEYSLEYKILVAVRGFGPIDLTQLDGEDIRPIASQLEEKGYLWWGPHLGYRITDAGIERLETIIKERNRK